MGRREAHLRQLADELDVELDLDKQPSPTATGVNGWWFFNGRRAEIGGWDGRKPLAYFAGLHELGHAANDHVGLNYISRMVEAEAEAWHWALDNASEPPSRTVAETILGPHWLGSYVGMPDTGPTGPQYEALVERLAT